MKCTSEECHSIIDEVFPFDYAMKMHDLIKRDCTIYDLNESYIEISRIFTESQIFDNLSSHFTRLIVEHFRRGYR